MVLRLVDELLSMAVWVNLNNSGANNSLIQYLCGINKIFDFVNFQHFLSTLISQLNLLSFIGRSQLTSVCSQQ